MKSIFQSEPSEPSNNKKIEIMFGWSMEKIGTIYNPMNVEFTLLGMTCMLNFKNMIEKID